MMRPGSFSPLGRARDVSLYFAAQAAAAVIFALPAVALVAGTGIGRFPEGDRLLFQPGGLVLADVARALSPHVASSTPLACASATLLYVLLLAPHAALLVSLSRAERDSVASAWGRAVGHLPRLLLVSGLALFLQATVLFAAVSAAGMVRDSLSGKTTRNADLAYIALVLVGLLLSLAVGLVRDLGRAAVVRGSPSTKLALREGLLAFARAPHRSLLGWAAPAATAFALMALGAVLTGVLDVSRPGAWRVWLVALLHQTIAYGLCWCRAFWLGRSLAIVNAGAIAR